VIDKHLKWTAHIDHISKKISRTNGILSKLKHTLPVFTLVNIYNALVLPHLNYGVFLWGWKNNKVNTLQKKAIRIISHSRYNSHTSIVFKSLNLLKFGDICALHDLKLCYKIENRQSPEFFSQFHSSIARDDSTYHVNTRFSSNIRLPRLKHEFARNSIAYRYSQIYNNMNPALKAKIYTHSMNGLKSYFKKVKIDSYSTECSIVNCYICNRHN